MREAGGVGRSLPLEEAEHVARFEPVLGQDRHPHLHRTEHAEDQAADPEERHRHVHAVLGGPLVLGRDELGVPDRGVVDVDDALRGGGAA